MTEVGEAHPSAPIEPNAADETRRKRKRLWTIIGSIVMFIIGVASALLVLLYVAPPVPSDAELITRILQMGRLSALPEGASEVETGGDSTMFQMTLLLRFDAPPNEIETFLAKSAGLQGVATEVLNPRHMYLPFPPNRVGDPAHRHYLPDPRHTWWDPLVQTSGRYFETGPDGDGVITQVIVDDEANTVFVRIER